MCKLEDQMKKRLNLSIRMRLYLAELRNFIQTYGSEELSMNLMLSQTTHRTQMQVSSWSVYCAASTVANLLYQTLQTHCCPNEV